jgi:hypothetical protein
VVNLATRCLADDEQTGLLADLQDWTRPQRQIARANATAIYFAQQGL